MTLPSGVQVRRAGLVQTPPAEPVPSYRRRSVTSGYIEVMYSSDTGQMTSYRSDAVTKVSSFVEVRQGHGGQTVSQWSVTRGSDGVTVVSDTEVRRVTVVSDTEVRRVTVVSDTEVRRVTVVSDTEVRRCHSGQ